MKIALSLVFLPLLFLTACGTTFAAIQATDPASQAWTTLPGDTPKLHTLTVFAAASLTEAFRDIGKAFETTHLGVTVIYNFGPAQVLRTQIEQGAPADVFASANTKEMDTLAMEGYVALGAPRIFVTNKMVVILPADNPAGIEKLADLAKPGIKLVLAAETVPAGDYARQVLAQMNAQFGSDFKDKVLVSLVSNEDNVKQVAARIQLGEADAGIVYISDAVAASGLKHIEIPPDLNVVARYPVAALTRSANAALAGEFVSYLLTPEAQAIFQKWGFGPVQ